MPKKYKTVIVDEVRHLRKLGKTYGEIRRELSYNFPKSTLSEWCKHVVLPVEYRERIEKLNFNNLNKARKIAVVINKIKREKYLLDLDRKNISISSRIDKIEVGKIALAMLCLGEASKYNPSRRTFCLGSSDSKIIIIFLGLLKKCFRFDIEKIRCTVQCRADQDHGLLQEYWISVTKIPRRLFYKPQIDPRTIGKPTKKTDYKGVLRIDYFDTNVQLELESISKLIYNRLNLGPEV